MRRLSSKRSKALAISADTKKAVYKRDNGLCVYCHSPGLPEAHYIARSHSGLGIEQNILTLCRRCHDLYDRGPRQTREHMRRVFRDYLSGKYEDWDESQLVYRRQQC